MILTVMVLAGTLSAWGAVLFQDQFTNITGAPDNTTWNDVGPNKGSTVLEAYQLKSRRTDMIRTIQTFDATVPGQPLTFCVDVPSPPLAYSGGADAAVMKVYTSGGAYPICTLYDYQGYGGYYGIDISLKRSTGTILYSKFINGTLGTYPMTIRLTLDATNASIQLVNGPYGNDVLWSGPHGVTGLAAARLALTNINGSSNGNEYLYARMDNALVASGLFVQGKVAMENYTGDARAIAALIELRQGGSVVKTSAQLLSSDGTFTMSDVVPGTYDVAIKTYIHQQKVLTGVSINTNRDLGTIQLLSGDCDGDSEVTSTDLSIILTNMDLVGDP